MSIEQDIPNKVGTIDINGIVLGQPYQVATDVFDYHNSEDISKLLYDLVNKYPNEKNGNSYIFTISEDEYLEIYYREDDSLLIMESFILRNTKYMF